MQAITRNLKYLVFLNVFLSQSLPRVLLPLEIVFHCSYLKPTTCNKKGWLCKNKVTLGCQSKISSPQIPAWAVRGQLDCGARGTPLWKWSGNACCLAGQPSRYAAPLQVLIHGNVSASSHEFCNCFCASLASRSEGAQKIGSTGRICVGLIGTMWSQVFPCKRLLMCNRSHTPPQCWINCSPGKTKDFC